MTNCIQASRQGGVVTLATAVILMLAVFGISYFMSETVIKDKQLAANAQRANEAFQNAHNGLDFVIAYIAANSLDDIFDASKGTDLVFDYLDSNGDGYSLPFEKSEVRIINSTDYFQVISEGLAADNTVRRVVSTWLSAVPADPEPPNVPVVAKGSAYISGNLEVTNNVEPLTIWTGENFDSNGSAETFINIDGRDDQLSSSKTTRGPDIVDRDANLAGATEASLLKSFFNVDGGFPGFATQSVVSNATWSFTASEEDYINATEPADDDTAKRVYINPGITADENKSCDANGSVDWLNIDLRDIKTSKDYPARIVVNGNVQISGGGAKTDFYGVVIAKKIKMVSGFNWYGGVVATDCVDTGNGGVSFYLDKTVMESLPLQPRQVYVRGSWRDWE